MDTALPQKIHFILDRNLAKANCTENHSSPSHYPKHNLPPLPPQRNLAAIKQFLFNCG